MNAAQMREQLKTLYSSSSSWQDKVNKMTDEQVTAIYLSKKRQGKI